MSHRRRSTRGNQRPKALATRRDEHEEPSETEDEAFGRLRSGAANIAGVTFQVATSALLLVGGRSGGNGLPTVVVVRPEGFEDVDCKLDDGSWLLVQCKQRSEGRRAISLVDLADMLAHASRALRTRDYDGSVSGLVVATDGEFAEQIVETGWHTSLQQHCDPAVLQRLEAQVESRLVDFGPTERALSAADVVKLARTVRLDRAVFSTVEMTLTDAYGVHPAVAAMGRAELFSDLSLVSAAQRGASVAGALVRSVHDLDVMIETINSVTDITALNEAVDAGVCEFANFLIGSPDSAKEFFAGVRVVPGHVAAGLDVPREAEMALVADSMSTNRHVLVVGPSGAGKSALMWRAAAIRSNGDLIVRVLRVADERDAARLVSYIARLNSTDHRRVLVCVDDLGREATASWPSARDRLLELPYVRLLGACRQEDLTPTIAIGATLSNATLDPSSAQLIYDRIQSSGWEMATEPEEAISLADGLLMEFIALATTGRRLQDVLAEQVVRMERELGAGPIAVLRIVLALHTLGIRAPAAALGRAVDLDESEITSCMRRLRDEHLVLAHDDGWGAIHDLRAEVLLDILHQSPPPSMSMTYARAISSADFAIRPALYRRALNRLAHGRESSASAEQAIASAHERLAPITSAIAADVREGVGAGEGVVVARLIELGERVDVIAYLSGTMPTVRASAPSTVDLNTYYLMVFAAKFSDVFRDNAMFATIAALGRSLPEWSGQAAQQAIGSVPAEEFASLIAEAELGVAVQLCESLEGAMELSINQARAVYLNHEPSSPLSLTLYEAGKMAQLIASLYSVARVPPDQAEAVFGDLDLRAEWAAAADDCVFRVNVRRNRLLSDLPASASSIARHLADDADRYTDVEVAAFVRLEIDGIANHAYAPQNGADQWSVNSQAVFLAQRLLDACPEAELVRVRLMSAAAGVDSEEAVPDGSKNLRQGVVPRRVAQRRNMATQAALIEFAGAERWTERCRSQAAVAAELVELLTQVPARLNPWDNSQRRRDWIAHLENLATSIQNLPGRPMEAVSGDIVKEAYERGSDLDGSVRDIGKDRSRRVLSDIVDALLQFGRDRANGTEHVGASMRLAACSADLVEARALDGLPAYAGVGQTLPYELDQLVLEAARNTAAFVRGGLPSRRLDTEQLRAAVVRGSVAAAEQERDLLLSLLGSAAIRVVATAVAEDPTSMVPSIFHQAVVGIEAEEWNLLGDFFGAQSGVLQGDAAHVFVPITSGRVLSLGIRTLPPSRTPAMITKDRVELAAGSLGHQTMSTRWQGVVGRVLAGMVLEHADRVRSQRRPSRWQPSAPRLIEPWRTSLRLDGPPAWIAAREALSELDHLISTSSGSIERFAQSISRAQPFPSADLDAIDELLPTRAVALAVLADLESLPEPDA